MSDNVMSINEGRASSVDPRAAFGAGEVRKHHARSDVMTILQSKDFRREIQRSVPTGVQFNTDRFLRLVETIYVENDRLCACDAGSLLGAVMKCAELGLVPGTYLQHVHIAASAAHAGSMTGCEYEARVIPGYRGLITLAMRSGEIASVSSRIVTDKEIQSGAFDLYFEGEKDTLVHKPILQGDRGVPELVYCIVRFKSGAFHVEPMTRAEVEAVRDAALAKSPWKAEDSAWKQYSDDMWRKTPIRRSMKVLDVQVEQLHAAIALDEAMELARSWRAAP